jgi:hypothetical protein
MLPAISATWAALWVRAWRFLVELSATNIAADQNATAFHVHAAHRKQA